MKYQIQLASLDIGVLQVNGRYSKVGKNPQLFDSLEEVEPLIQKLLATSKVPALILLPVQELSSEIPSSE
jgi:hypothetical protein